MSTGRRAIHVQQSFQVFGVVTNAVCGDYSAAKSHGAGVEDTFGRMELLIVAEAVREEVSQFCQQRGCGACIKETIVQPKKALVLDVVRQGGRQ